MRKLSLPYFATRPVTVSLSWVQPTPSTALIVEMVCVCVCVCVCACVCVHSVGAATFPLVIGVELLNETANEVVLLLQGSGGSSATATFRAEVGKTL